jgi:2'-5' RNA ligase
MKRIFIALKVQPEEPFSMMISAFRSGLKHEVIKWTSPENIHITLVFLGDREEETIKAISSMLHGAWCIVHSA